MGLEPTTLGLRVPCSTDWANRASVVENMITCQFQSSCVRKGSILPSQKQIPALDAISDLDICTLCFNSSIHSHWAIAICTMNSLQWKEFYRRTVLCNNYDCRLYKRWWISFIFYFWETRKVNGTKNTGENSGYAWTPRPFAQLFPTNNYAHIISECDITLNYLLCLNFACVIYNLYKRLRGPKSSRPPPSTSL